MLTIYAITRHTKHVEDPQDRTDDNDAHNTGFYPAFWKRGMSNN